MGSAFLLKFYQKVIDIIRILVYNLGMNNTSYYMYGSQEEVAKAQVLRKRLISNLRKNPRVANPRRATLWLKRNVLDAKLFIEFEHLTDFREWQDTVSEILIARAKKSLTEI